MTLDEVLRTKVVHADVDYLLIYDVHNILFTVIPIRFLFIPFLAYHKLKNTFAIKDLLDVDVFFSEITESPVDRSKLYNIRLKYDAKEETLV